MTLVGVVLIIVAVWVCLRLIDEIPAALNDFKKPLRVVVLIVALLYVLGALGIIGPAWRRL